MRWRYNRGVSHNRAKMGLGMKFLLRANAKDHLVSNAVLLNIIANNIYNFAEQIACCPVSFPMWVCRFAHPSPLSLLLYFYYQFLFSTNWEPRLQRTAKLIEGEIFIWITVVFIISGWISRWIEGETESDSSHSWILVTNRSDI